MAFRFDTLLDTLNTYLGFTELPSLLGEVEEGF